MVSSPWDPIMRGAFFFVDGAFLFVDVAPSLLSRLALLTTDFGAFFLVFWAPSALSCDEAPLPPRLRFWPAALLSDRAISPTGCAL